MAHVYWLRLPEHQDFLTEGYIGAASDIAARLRSHKHRFKAIWHKVVVEFLVESSIDYCFELEAKLRPNRNIGWNVAAGGYRNNVMKGTENPNYGKFGASAPHYVGSDVTPLGIFDSSTEAAKAHKMFVSTIARKCKGRIVNGKFLPPQDGWSFIRKAG
jgi:hypothetical protein